MSILITRKMLQKSCLIIGKTSKCCKLFLFFSLVVTWLEPLGTSSPLTRSEVAPLSWRPHLNILAKNTVLIGLSHFPNTRMMQQQAVWRRDVFIFCFHGFCTAVHSALQHSITSKFTSTYIKRKNGKISDICQRLNYCYLELCNYNLLLSEYRKCALEVHIEALQVVTYGHMISTN